MTRSQAGCCQGSEWNSKSNFANPLYTTNNLPIGFRSWRKAWPSSEALWPRIKILRDASNTYPRCVLTSPPGYFLLDRLCVRKYWVCYHSASSRHDHHIDVRIVRIYQLRSTTFLWVLFWSTKEETFIGTQLLFESLLSGGHLNIFVWTPVF